MPRFYAPFDKTWWYQPPHTWQAADVSLREDLFKTGRTKLWLGRWRRTLDDEMTGVICDTPWGDMIVVQCQHPLSPAERWDIPTGMWCHSHNRTVYYCDELKRLWCDGGPPDFAYHVFRIVAVPDPESRP